MKPEKFRRASDPLSLMVYGLLDALEKRIRRFVVSEMNQIVRFIHKMRRR